jgi:3-dehydroquinate synthase
MSSAPSIAHELTVEYPGGSYPVRVGQHLLDSLGSTLRELRADLSDRVLIVTDENVEPLYAARATNSLGAAGFSVSTSVLPAGEASKRLPHVEDLYEACVRSRLDRRSAILALGGGVVGDIAGLAAATFLRGLPFVQVPTTLLAMVDSSIGGKVGVDLPQGKNLVGAFKQPLAVHIDIGCLSSLPDRELRSGCAEIVKAALLRGEDSLRGVAHLVDAVALHGWHAPQTTPILLRALCDALICKRDIVAQDPFEQGLRALLNLGHTFAHAIEAWSHYAIPHGEAVALGLLCALRLSQARGLCEQALVMQIASLLARLGLPVRLARAAACAHEILACMQHDKKRGADGLRFILLRRPGSALIAGSVPASEVLATLKQLEQDPPASEP